MTATKTQRTLSYNRLTGILHLADRKGEKGYYLDRLDHDFGPGCVAFRLTKIVTTPGEPSSYPVLVGDDFDSCECLGHLRHGRCKHAAAIRCLKQRGSI